MLKSIWIIRFAMNNSIIKFWWCFVFWVFATSKYFLFILSYKLDCRSEVLNLFKHMAQLKKTEGLWPTDCTTSPMWQLFSDVASTKFGTSKILGGKNIWLSSSHSVFVWDAASQSTKWVDVQKIWGEPWPPGYAYATAAHVRIRNKKIFNNTTCATINV